MKAFVIILLISSSFVLFVLLLYNLLSKSNDQELIYIKSIENKLTEITTLQECNNLLALIRNKYFANVGNNFIQNEYKKIYYKLLGIQIVLNKLSSQSNL